MVCHLVPLNFAAETIVSRLRRLETEGGMDSQPCPGCASVWRASGAERSSQTLIRGATFPGDASEWLPLAEWWSRAQTRSACHQQASVQARVSVPLKPFDLPDSTNRRYWEPYSVFSCQRAVRPSLGEPDEMVLVVHRLADCGWRVYCPFAQERCRWECLYFRDPKGKVESGFAGQQRKRLIGLLGDRRVGVIGLDLAVEFGCFRGIFLRVVVG